MPNFPIKGQNDGDGISRGSSSSYQSSWMTHWTRGPSKQKSIINLHSSTFSAKPSFAGRIQNQLVSGINHGSLKFHVDKGKESEAQVVGLLNGSKNLIAEKCDYESFWSFSLSREKRNSMTAQTAPDCKNAITTLTDSKSSLAGDLQPSLGCFMTSQLSLQKKPLVVSQPSEEGNVVKLASVDRHKEMNRDLTMGFFMSEACVSGSYQGVRPLDMGNVFETRRICPTADNSRGSPPMFSQTTHHFLFPEKTGADLSKRQQIFPDAKESTQHEQGGRIQPLVASTDVTQEKDGDNDAETMELDAGSESSAKTHSIMSAFLNKNVSAGLASSEPIEQQLRDQQGLTACADLQSENILGKRPITEKASTNKNLHCCPHERSFIDGITPGTSNPHKLDTDHLLNGTGQSKKSKSDQFQEPSTLTEPSIRWVKRLKPSCSNCSWLGTKTSKMVESTSHEKQKKVFFNIGCCQTNSIHKETIGSDQNVDPSSPGKKDLDMMLCCYSWIGRWCQNPSPARKLSVKSPSALICEPNSSNLPFNELVKGQFPSIGAMALMGKSLSGLWQCELTRRGPLVIWNTKEY